IIRPWRTGTRSVSLVASCSSSNATGSGRAGARRQPGVPDRGAPSRRARPRRPTGVAGLRRPVPRLHASCPTVVNGRVRHRSHSHHRTSSSSCRSTRSISGSAAGERLASPRWDKDRPANVSGWGDGPWGEALHACPGRRDSYSQQRNGGGKVDSVEAVTVQHAEPSGLRRYVSLLEGIRPYQRSWLQTDIVAGITLAALAIPEVMGYTKIAGMPVITGLYTILIPVLAFAVFGSSRHLVVGGDSATAAIMFAGIASLGIAGLQPNTSQWVGLASLSALLAAALPLLARLPRPRFLPRCAPPPPLPARLARLGFLADFISRTVLIGFLTGVGIQVALGQLAGMLGVPS